MNFPLFSSYLGVFCPLDSEFLWESRGCQSHLSLCILCFELYLAYCGCSVNWMNGCTWSLLISTYLCFWFGFLISKAHELLFLETHTYSRLPFLRFWWVGSCKVTDIHCCFLILYNDCTKGHSSWGRVGLGAIAREVREEAAGERIRPLG